MAEKENNFWYFRHVNNIEELKKYFEGREYRHTYFYHYTTLKVIDSIIGNKEFWLSCVSGFNDKRDVRQFGNSAKEYYSLCFSTGVNENLSLWYLYSGLDGKGGRIKLKPARIRTLIEKGTFELYEYDNNYKIKTNKICTLKKGKDMETELRDILYLRESDGKFSLKYNTMTNYNFTDNAEFEKIKNHWCKFSKGLIWYYEKETRLLLHLTGEIKNIVENSNKDYVVVLKFDDEILKNIEVDFAPEITDIDTALKSFDNMRNFKKTKSNINLSEYSGDIQMNMKIESLKGYICEKCEKANPTLADNI